jgi:hypothetical protein
VADQPMNDATTPVKRKRGRPPKTPKQEARPHLNEAHAAELARAAPDEETLRKFEARRVEQEKRERLIIREKSLRETAIPQARREEIRKTRQSRIDEYEKMLAELEVGYAVVAKAVAALRKFRERIPWKDIRSNPKFKAAVLREDIEEDSDELGEPVPPLARIPECQVLGELLSVAHEIKGFVEWHHNDIMPLTTRRSLKRALSRARKPAK